MTTDLNTPRNTPPASGRPDRNALEQAWDAFWYARHPVVLEPAQSRRVRRSRAGMGGEGVGGGQPAILINR